MLLYILLFYWLVRFASWIFRNINWKSITVKIFTRRSFRVNALFAKGFIDSPVLYTTTFNELPNVSMIRQIDASKAYAIITESFANEIMAMYQYNTFDYNENKALFNITVFVLRGKRLVEIGYDYAEIFYTGKQYAWANGLLNNLATCKAQRTQVMGFVRTVELN